MIYLKIDSIKGNCTEEPYKEQMIIDSYSHGVSQFLTTRPGNTERTSDGPQFSEMTFSKTLDSASPGLYQACTQNSKLGEATITVTRVEGGKVMETVKYVLGNAMVSNISTSGSGSGDLPSESFSLNFTSITTQMTQQNADSTKKGVSSFGWDLTKTEALAPK